MLLTSLHSHAGAWARANLCVFQGWNYTAYWTDIQSVLRIVGRLISFGRFVSLDVCEPVVYRIIGGFFRRYGRRK
jgi:hypothetical protein